METPTDAGRSAFRGRARDGSGPAPPTRRRPRPRSGGPETTGGGRPAHVALARKILLIEARGDFEGAAALLERYGDMSDPMRQALDRLDDVPVDVRPRYAVKERMEAW